MIKIAICDDNKANLSILKSNINSGFLKYTDDFTITVYENGLILLKDNSLNPFDVIFLDIDMPKIDGFNIAQKIRSTLSSCFIIFVTSYSELVYRSLDFQPFHFIRKLPAELLYKRITEVIDKLMQHLKQSSPIVLEDDISGRIVTYYRNVICIKSEKHYLYYYIKDHDNPIKVRGMLSSVEEEFSEFDFIRIHRNYIINLALIQKLDLKIGSVYVVVSQNS